jgi:hypothetical protein
VRTLSDCGQLLGAAVHRATGTLLAACARATAIRLMDIRPPPSDWKFVKADDLRVDETPQSIEIDEAHGFVYVSELAEQRITQWL